MRTSSFGDGPRGIQTWHVGSNAGKTNPSRPTLSTISLPSSRANSPESTPMCLDPSIQPRRPHLPDSHLPDSLRESHTRDKTGVYFGLPKLVRAPLAALVLMLLLCGVTYATAQAQECTSAACVSSLGNLAEIDSTKSELLDPLLGALLGDGAALGLSAADYDALANLDVDVGELLERLQLDLAIATPEQLLVTDLTFSQLIDALDAILPENVGIDALQSLELPDGVIRLGDLLQIDLEGLSLAEIDLNLLDLVVGAIQLFNHSNAVAVEAVALDGDALSALGLPGQGIEGVSLRATVLEAPMIICGPEGTEFRSANVRVALDVDLAQSSTTLSDVNVTVGSLTSVTASPAITLASLSLYIDVAGGRGAIQTIDPVAPSVTISATPSIARIYLGDTAAIGDFFSVDFDPATDVISATIGEVAASVEVCLVALCPDIVVHSLISARTTAEGSSGSQSFTFAGPFPQSHTFESSASSIATLVGQLLANLELDIDLVLQSGTLDPAIITALGGTIDPLLSGLESGLLAPLTNALGTELFQDEISVLLGNVGDPLLDTLGLGIGKSTVVVFGAAGDSTFAICAPLLGVTVSTSPNPLRTGTAGVVALTLANAANAGATTGPVTVTVTLPANLAFTGHSPATWQRVGTGTTPFTFVYTPTLAGGDSTTLNLHVAAGAVGEAPLAGSVVTAGQGATPFSHTAQVAAINPDEPGDEDGDGIPDNEECPEGVANCPDTDGDGTPDHQDADDDGDGVFTVVECPLGTPCPDSDGDGTPDHLDPDDDGDGVYTIVECPAGRTTSASAPCPNTDGDNAVDYLDTDDDNDGLTTRAECPAGRTSAASPLCPDSDGDTLPDYLDAVDDRISPDDDTDGDGIPDQVECPNGLATCPDTDDDDTPDYLDTDDDGDGIGTIVECPAGPPCPDSDGDTLPDHRDVDDDGDGVYTAVECPAGRATNADPDCPDTDGDTAPNYLDTDDDDDGAPTMVECPDGRTALSAPECPAVGNPELEDYLNPDFALYGVQFGPIVFTADEASPTGR